MKYTYILIAIMLMGCSDKSQKLEKVAEENVKIEVVEVAKVEEPKQERVKKILLKQATPIHEPKITRTIDLEVPTSCAMWSDGCNVCTHLGKRKASCTTNPECTHKMFSCLQWQ